MDFLGCFTIANSLLYCLKGKNMHLNCILKLKRKFGILTALPKNQFGILIASEKMQFGAFRKGINSLRNKYLFSLPSLQNC